MSKTPFSTVIDVSIKKATTNFCKTNGIKLQHFVENALLDQLEDAQDLQSYILRKNEETVSYAQALKTLRSKKKP